jgi:magnesium transporter
VVIVDQAVYREGHRLRCGDLGNELASLRRLGQGFIWIGLKDPTLAEFALVEDELHLHPLAVEDAVKGNQRPKFEVYDGSLFVVMKTLRYVARTSDIETGEVMVFVGDRFVVTARRGEANPLTEVRHRLERAPDQLEHGPIAVLYSVMDSVVDNYVAVDKDVSGHLDAIERDVFSGEARDASAEAVYALKREVLEFKRATLPLEEPLRRLTEDPTIPGMKEVARPFFRDISDHLLRVIDHAESCDRLLTDVLNAHLAQISVQQNDDMRRISAWVAIAAVPTMIAGIYGMNFEHIPELHYHYAYFVALAVMALLCAGLYRAFRRSGWL